ncbi:hypothetical protein [Hydrogenophaga intermedia]|uniref:hypothetical protein n=1 Tax=Hydrogenophaga intermedia TaxID=65786 RepID=UPI0012E8755E|nr:hypothetical protein [Hydrogenophaga intermedia]
MASDLTSVGSRMKAVGAVATRLRITQYWPMTLSSELPNGTAARALSAFTWMLIMRLAPWS